MTPSPALRVLSAGACQSLFRQVTDRWVGAPICASFAPVGRLTQQLREGESADILLTSRVALRPLLTEALVLTGSVQTVGWVPTAVAVPEGANDAALADATDATSFARRLRDYAHIYLPDTERATAGRQVLKLLRATGTSDVLAERLHAAPSGAAAVLRMVSDGYDSAVAFAQKTEIIATAGATPVCGLPKGFELVTEYCIALVRRPTLHSEAKTFTDQFQAQLRPAMLAQLGFSVAATN